MPLTPVLTMTPVEDKSYFKKHLAFCVVCCNLCGSLIRQEANQVPYTSRKRWNWDLDPGLCASKGCFIFIFTASVWWDKKCNVLPKHFPSKVFGDELKAKVLRTGTRFSVVVMDTCHIPHIFSTARIQPLEKTKFSQAVGTFQLLKCSCNE